MRFFISVRKVSVSASLLCSNHSHALLSEPGAVNTIMTHDLEGTQTACKLHQMIIVITFSSKSARCVWHKSCLVRQACSEHHEMDV